MAGRIETKDLINAPEIKKDLAEIAEELKNLTAQISKTTQEAVELKKEFDKGADSQKETATRVSKVSDNLDVLAKSEQEVMKLEKQYKDLLAKTRAERSEEGKQLVKLKSLRAEQNKKIKEEIELEKTQANSIKRLTLENKKLRKERDNLSVDTQADKIEELNGIIDQNTETIRANTDGLTSQRMGVGGYSDALAEFFPRIGQASEGVEGFNKKLLKLLMNPVVAIIAALILVITALFKAFTKTQAGADAFADTMAAVGSIVDVVIGRLGRLAKAVVKLVKGDFKGAWEAAKGAVSGVREEIEKTLAETQKIQALKRGLEELNIAATTAIANLNKVAEEQAAIADDATKSFQERRRAADEADKASKKAVKEQIKLSELSLTIIKAENDLKEQQGMLTRELRQQEADAVAQLIDLRKDLSVKTIESEKRIAELRQDNWEQELDFLIDVADVQKTVNEKKIADDKRTFKERFRILEETKALTNESFDSQIKLFETENAIAIDRQKLAELNNKEIFEYARGLQLSEIETNRLLEVIRERRMAVSDLQEAEADLNEQRRAGIISTAQENANALILIDKKRLLEGRTDEKEHAAEVVSIQMEMLSELLLNKELSNEQLVGLETQLVDKQLEIQRRAAEEEKGILKEKEALKREIFTESLDFLGTLADRRIQNLEAEAEHDLMLAGDNAGEKARIERKLDNERKKIQRRQAILAKGQAVFNAIINTKESMTKTAAAVPFPANVPLVALAGILGGVQVASILAAPIPKFAKGTHSSPEGLAIVGEEGHEMIEYASGHRAITPNTATMTYLPKGSKVKTAEETKEILGASNEAKFDELIKATKQNGNKKSVLRQTIITDEGFKTMVRDTNSSNTLINDYFRK